MDYKFSQYNRLIPYKEHYIYYNSFSNKFLHLRYELIEIIKSRLKEPNPKYIYDLHEDLYNELLRYGYIVNVKTDEYQNAIDRVRKINSQKGWFKLIINPTLNCNFNCWYCYENKVASTKMDDNITERVKLLINNICKDEELKTLELSFFGGEPLLYYKNVVLPICEYAYKTARSKGKEFLITFTTNGYLINKNIIEKLKKIGLCLLQITFDGNKTNHDKTRFLSGNRGSFDVIVNNIKELVSEGVKVVMRVNYTEKNLVGLEDLLCCFDDLSLDKKNLITLSMNKVWQESNTNLYKRVEEIENLAKEKGFSLTDALLGNTVLYPCYADKENEAVINYNGNVYKCNARDFKESNKEGFLNEHGVIIWNQNHSKRIKAQLTNKSCIKCSIFPICGGGCSQNALENYDKDYCIHNFDQEKIDKIVIDMFLSQNTVEY